LAPLWEDAGSWPVPLVRRRLVRRRLVRVARTYYGTAVALYGALQLNTGGRRRKSPASLRCSGYLGRVRVRVRVRG
jgi:hypothetical protein